MSLARAAGGFVCGLIVCGLVGFALRPTPAEAPPEPAPVATAAPRSARVVTAECPPMAPAGADGLERAREALLRRKRLLEGRLEGETGADLPPRTAAEAPEVVEAWLREHIGEGELELDCAEHPCRGRATWPMDLGNDPDASMRRMGEKDAFREAVFERYPDSKQIDTFTADFSEIIVRFAVAEKVETDAQRLRVKRAAEGR